VIAGLLVAVAVARVVVRPVFPGVDLEIDGEQIVVDLDRGREVAAKLEIVVAATDDLHRRILEARGEDDRIARGQARGDSGPQTQFAAQSRDRFVLGGLYADRNFSSPEMDQSTGVDPRDRRVSVDQRRVDGEAQTLALYFDPDARSFSATRGRELLRFDSQRDAFFEIRDDLGHEQGEIVVTIEAAARQVRELAAGQLVGRERMQRVVREDKAVSEGAFDAPVLLHEESHAARCVDDSADQAKGFGFDLDRLPVQEHALGSRELVEQIRDVGSPSGVGGAACEYALDRDVRGGRDEIGAAAVAGGDRGQAALQGRALALELDGAGHAQVPRTILEFVDDASLAFALGRKFLAGLLGTAKRDHTGGDVLTRIFGRIAAALPILVFGMQCHLWCAEPFLRRDAKGDRFVETFLDAHGVPACERDTSRPDRARTGLLHGLEDQLHIIQRSEPFHAIEVGGPGSLTDLVSQRAREFGYLQNRVQALSVEQIRMLGRPFAELDFERCLFVRVRVIGDESGQMGERLTDVASRPGAQGRHDGTTVEGERAHLLCARLRRSGLLDTDLDRCETGLSLMCFSRVRDGCEFESPPGEERVDLLGIVALEQFANAEISRDFHGVCSRLRCLEARRPSGRPVGAAGRRRVLRSLALRQDRAGRQRPTHAERRGPGPGGVSRGCG